MAPRSPFAASAAALFGTLLLAFPAAAQFGTIFGDPPPRPPSSVPGGRQQMPSPPQYPPQGGYPDSAGYPNGSPGGYTPSYPSSTGYPPSGRGPAGSPGGVQSRPLPSPGGPATGEPAARPPIQRPARVTPTPSEVPATDEAIAEPPSQRIPNNAALFSGLDKITGRIINFEVAIGETVQFGALQLTPRACYTRPATETTNTDSFIEVDEVTLQGEVRRIFTGWVFAASPGLHAVEHPIYDLWLTDCKGPVVTAEKSPAADPAPVTTTATPARPPQPKQQPKQQARQPAPPQQGIPQYR